MTSTLTYPWIGFRLLYLSLESSQVCSGRAGCAGRARDLSGVKLTRFYWEFPRLQSH